MKTIPLTQGKFAIVDDQDYEWLNKYKWFAQKGRNTYYARRNICLPNGKQMVVKMHREILGLQLGDNHQTHHVNYNGLNNRRMNLQIVTECEHQWTRIGAKGYYWNKRHQKFHSQISARGKKIYLGSFDSANEARKAYLVARKERSRWNDWVE